MEKARDPRIQAIGRRIEAIRENKSMTRKTMAAELTALFARSEKPVSEQQVYQWEAGIRNPQLKNLLGMAQVLNVSPARFMEDPAPPLAPTAHDLDTAEQSLSEAKSRVDAALDAVRALRQPQPKQDEDLSGGVRRKAGGRSDTSTSPADAGEEPAV